MLGKAVQQHPPGSVLARIELQFVTDSEDGYRMSVEPKIVCNNIWKVFGPKPEHTLKEIDRSLSRADVQQQTGHVIAVKDVSFSVKQGETFVVMGLSGSGKSTLVRCLSRLIDPTEGQVLIDGQDITTVSQSELKSLRRYKMAMVFQHFGLLPHRRVIDNVAYGLEVRGEGREKRYEKALETIKLVGLDGWEDRYPRELSGGMQQRVGLARAMAVEPEILLFDEPFSALDPLIRREMQDELLDLQARLKKTMVFITHDFLEAIKMGDNIMIMRDGAVSQTGSPEDIVANPIDKYVADFTEDVPRYKVLSAGKVMRPLDGSSTSPGMHPAITHPAITHPEVTQPEVTQTGVPATVPMSAKIESLIDLVADSDTPVKVVDDNGVPCGEIDRSIVMKAMNARV